MTTPASDGGPGRDPIRVFLVDDDHLFREGLRRLLDDEDAVTVVGQAADAKEALRAIEGSGPDVALLDVRLPGVSGIELCREIRSRWPKVACVMLTAVTDDEAAFRAVMAGASGYVLKRTRPMELVGSLQQVVAGGSLLDAQVAAHLVERIRDDGHGADEVPGGVTVQEREILDLVAEGLTNREIAERVHLAEKTVKNYVSRILKKLDMARRTEVIAYMAEVRHHRRFTS